VTFRVALILMVILAACDVGKYYIQPRMGVTYRDEQFSGPSGVTRDDYYGETYYADFTLMRQPRPLEFAAPLVFDEAQLGRIERALVAHGGASGPVVIDHHDDSPPEPDSVGKLIDKTDSIVADATWPVVGALLSIALIIWVLRRKPVRVPT
jgi:hypothetical protein